MIQPRGYTIAYSFAGLILLAAIGLHVWLPLYALSPEQRPVAELLADGVATFLFMVLMIEAIARLMTFLRSNKRNKIQ